MSYLILKDVSKSFGSTKVLEAINLSINKNEIVALLGESGSGKTTLLRIISGLETVSNGSVFLNNNLLEDSSTFIKTEDRKVGVIFQDYALFPHLTVAKNIAFGLKVKDTTLVNSFLEKFELAEHKKKKPSQLSGGQQQRVAIARSLITNPNLLLLDEPFSSLDQSLKRKVRTEISEVLRSQNITSILVTHDPEDALQMADKIAVLQKGKIVQFDTPENIYRFPVNDYVGKLTGIINVVKGELIRPENLKIEKTNTGSLIVIKSIFMNGRYLISYSNNKDTYHSYFTEDLEQGSYVCIVN